MGDPSSILTVSVLNGTLDEIRGKFLGVSVESITQDADGSYKATVRVTITNEDGETLVRIAERPMGERDRILVGDIDKEFELYLDNNWVIGE